MVSGGAPPRTLRRGSDCPHCGRSLVPAPDAGILLCTTDSTVAYRVGQPVPERPVVDPDAAADDPLNATAPAAVSNGGFASDAGTPDRGSAT